MCAGVLLGNRATLGRERHEHDAPFTKRLPEIKRHLGLAEGGTQGGIPQEPLEPVVRASDLGLIVRRLQGIEPLESDAGRLVLGASSEGGPELVAGKLEDLEGLYERELVFVKCLEDGSRNAGKKGRLIRAPGPPHIG